MLKRKPLLKNNHLKLVLSFVMILGISFLFAQNSSQLENQLTSWGVTIRKIIRIVAGIMAFVGAAMVAFQYFQGNENANKNIIRLIVGLVIIGAIDLIVGIFITP